MAYFGPVRDSENPLLQTLVAKSMIPFLIELLLNDVYS